MNKEDIIYITNNLYRLTQLFPKKEPLRYKMREVGGEILANLVLAINGNSRKPQGLYSGLEKELEVLDSFFEVAMAQNWVAPVNVLAIREQYVKILEDFRKLNLAEKEGDSSKESVSSEGFRAYPLVQRQQKILEILKEKGKVQVWEVKQTFPEVTKRTLRRDFEKMLDSGLIERLGERNKTFYQLRSYQG